MVELNVVWGVLCHFLKKEIDCHKKGWEGLCVPLSRSIFQYEILSKMRLEMSV